MYTLCLGPTNFYFRAARDHALSCLPADKPRKLSRPFVHRDLDTLRVLPYWQACGRGSRSFLRGHCDMMLSGVRSSGELPRERSRAGAHMARFHAFLRLGSRGWIAAHRSESI